MERFKTLIEESKQEEMIELLKSMSKDEKEKLTPLIKNLSKEYYQPGQFSGTHSYVKGSKKQRTMLVIAAFVCYNLADFEKSRFIDDFVCRQPFLSQVIDWYCPEWFNTYANKLSESKRNGTVMSYDWMMELTTRGILTPSPSLIANALLAYAFHEENNILISKLKPENLLRWEVTLDHHIWVLFETPSSIIQTNGWLNAFKQLAEENKINRHRLLQQSLLTSNRNFNKTLYGWFCQLFIELQPQKHELLTLQPELFSALSSQQSKPVNTALNALKDIIDENGFDLNSFIQQTPILLASETKWTVKTTLSLFTKLAKKQQEKRKSICIAACQTFLQADLVLQATAAKILNTYGSPDDIEIRQAVADIQSNIRESVKPLLKEYFTIKEENNVVPETTAITCKPPAQDPSLVPVIFPKNINDIVSLASQAFDNNDPSHIDVLPAAILKFQNDFTAGNIQKLTPAFQKALKLASTSCRGNQGALDDLLARFFIDFGHWIMNRFPKDCQDIKMLYEKYNEPGNFTIDWTKIPTNASFTETARPLKNINCTIPHKLLLMATLKKLQLGDQLPLLSTPVYSQGWIDPRTLIDRLQQYQQNNTIIDEFDLQVAISRCVQDSDSSMLTTIPHSLSGELKSLMLFLLDDKEVTPYPENFKAAWIIASLSKPLKKQYKIFEDFPHYTLLFNFYAGQPDYQFSDKYETEGFDYLSESFVESILDTGCIRLNIWNNEKDYHKKIQGQEFGFLYNFLPINERETYLKPISNDMERVLNLLPSNPDPLIASLIRNGYHVSYNYDTEEKKIVSAVLRVLNQTWTKPRPVPMLFLANSITLPDEIIATMSGEIWLKTVKNGTMDNIMLGSMLGKMQAVNYSPLKRLIDIIKKQLFNISALHNKELLILTTAILKEVKGIEIKNLKKLLLLHSELETLVAKN